MRRPSVYREKLINKGITQNELRQKIEETTGEEQIKYRALLAILMGQPVGKIEENLKIHKGGCYNWTRRYLTFGPSAFVNGPTGPPLDFFDKPKIPRKPRGELLNRSTHVKLTHRQFEDMRKFAQALDSNVSETIRILIEDFLGNNDPATFANRLIEVRAKQKAEKVLKQYQPKPKLVEEKPPKPKPKPEVVRVCPFRVLTQRKGILGRTIVKEMQPCVKTSCYQWSEKKQTCKM